MVKLVGYDGVGASIGHAGLGADQAVFLSTSQTATAGTMATAHFDNPSTQSGENIKLAIWNTSGSLIAVSGAVNLATVQEYSTSISGTLTAINYHVGWVQDGYANFYHDGSGFNGVERNTSSYSTPASITIPGNGINRGLARVWIEGTAGGVAITTPETTLARGQQVVQAVTGAGATQGSGGITYAGIAVTIDSWSDTSVTYTIPTTLAKQHSVTGYPMVITGNDLSTDTTANIPFTPETGMTYTDLTSIAGTDADFTFGYSGATVASGKQVVYETPTLEDSLAIVVSADCSYTLGSPLTQNNTSDYYVIDADGTIGVTDTNTFVYAAPGGSINLIGIRRYRYRTRRK